MKKKKKSTIAEKIAMEKLMMNEASLYYLTFLNDTIVIKNEITFTKQQAEKYYVSLLNHTINLYNRARTLKERQEASVAFLSLQIYPLRIH